MGTCRFSGAHEDPIGLPGTSSHPEMNLGAPPSPPIAPALGRRQLHASVLVSSALCRIAELPLSPAGHEASVAVVWGPPLWPLVPSLSSENRAEAAPEAASQEVGLTFRLDSEGRTDQGEEGGVESDSAIAVQRHVHAHQALREQRQAR